MGDSAIPFYSYNDLVLLAEKAVEKRGFGYIYPSQVARDEGIANYDWGSADYFYEDDTCVYMFDKDKPGCLVGEIMYIANLITDIPRWNAGESVIAVLNDHEIPPFRTDQQGLEFLTYIQSAQDTGKPWGIAVSLAKERIEREYGLGPYGPPAA